MPPDEIPGQHSVPYNDYRKVNSAAKRMRQERQRIAGELKAAQATIEQQAKDLRILATGYQDLQKDPRLQIAKDQLDQFQSYMDEQRFSQHMQSFEGALDGLLAEGVTARQILMAVGYSPEMVQEITPEIIQSVVDTAYQEFPQLFQSVSSQNAPAEPQTDQSLPGQMTAAFEQGAMVQQQQPNTMFAQTGRPQQAAPQGQQVPPQAYRPVPNGMVPQQSAPQPPQFRGYGDLQGRGGPAPTNLQSMSARLRDPAWLAANQGALAQAVASGATIQSNDS